MTVVQQSLMWGASLHYGDGKPIILVPRYLDSDFSLIPQSGWLKAFGYSRRLPPACWSGLNNSGGQPVLSKAIRDATRRVGRKGVLVIDSTAIGAAAKAAFGSMAITDWWCCSASECGSSCFNLAQRKHI